MLRRSLLILPVAMAAGACSVVPERPYVETRRFGMDLRRPATATAAATGRRGRRTLLVRLMRAAPDLDRPGLRSVMPDGSVTVDFWEAWVAPPPELAEAAMRRWLDESGLFAAIAGPGTRARVDLVLETELTALHAEPGTGLARAAISVVLLREGAISGDVVSAFSVAGQAPMPRATDGNVPAEVRVQAMTEALGAALTQMERRLRRLV
jgi:cholesterol transport system auxiliary component